MKTIVAVCFVLATAFLFSCRRSGDKTKPKVPIDSLQWNVDTVLAEKDKLLNGILGNTHGSMSIDSSDHIILPLTAPLLLREGKSLKTYYNADSYKSGTSYWNLVFYNTVTSEAHLLDTGKLLICDMHVNNLETYGRFADGFLFYTIIIKDFNGNDQLDFADPRYLYMSDKAGKNLTRLSPENADVVSWEFPKKSNFILMKIRYDLNKDMKFDEEDPSSLIRIDIGSTIVQTPLLNGSFENEIKRIFKKYYTERTDSAE